MKYYLFLPFYLCFYILNAQNQPFEKAFKTQYVKAQNFVKENQVTFQKYLDTPEINWKIAVAIIFPELVRYSDIKDFLEIKTLEMLYVKGGNMYANFSIGRFQMKPAFAESIEDFLIKNKMKGVKLFQYETKNEKEIRQERVKRLSELLWQIQYLKAFYLIINHRFPNKKFSSDVEKVKFYAAAYNLGFLQTEQKIEDWQKGRFFPYGKAQPSKKQYIYAEIAADFFKKL